jgi:hypothetical protein
VPSRGGHYEVKRHFERIHFEHALPARLGEFPVQLIDLAIGGARIMGETRFTPGSTHELRVEWEGKTIRMNCRVTRCTLHTFAKAPGEKSTYESGLHIEETIGDSHLAMRELIATYVMRALEEQKANWRGAYPIGPYVYMEGKSDRYRRCELVDGKWRRTATSRPEQPLTGFTVSADVPPRYVDLLCETYEMTNDEGRRLTRILAELSISKAEGVPTRRYVP